MHLKMWNGTRGTVSCLHSALVVEKRIFIRTSVQTSLLGVKHHNEKKHFLISVYSHVASFLSSPEREPSVRQSEVETSGSTALAVWLSEVGLGCGSAYKQSTGDRCLYANPNRSFLAKFPLWPCCYKPPKCQLAAEERIILKETSE